MIVVSQSRQPLPGGWYFRVSCKDGRYIDLFVISRLIVFATKWRCALYYFWLRWTFRATATIK